MSRCNPIVYPPQCVTDPKVKVTSLPIGNNCTKPIFVNVCNPTELSVGTSCSNPIFAQICNVDGSPIEVSTRGNYTNNLTTPGPYHEQVLTALANAVAPTWTEGNEVLLSVDLDGNLRTLATVTLDQGASCLDPLYVNVCNAQNSAVATAADPTYVEGDDVPLSVDLNGNLRTLATVTFSIGGSCLDPLYTNVCNLLNTQGSTTAGQSGPLMQGAVTSLAPSYTTAQTSPLSLTTAGLLRVDASGQIVPITAGSGAFIANSFAVGSIRAGAIAAGAASFVHLEDDASANLDAGVGCLAVRKAAPANTSGADGDYEFIQMSAGRVWASTLVPALELAQGSTTSAQTGPLIQGAVTTAAPSYTTAQTSPLSLDTAGNLRVTGTFSIAANSSVNVAQIAGTTTSVNNGAVDNGTQRVTIANNSTGILAGVTTVTAVTAITNALPAGTNLLGKVGIDQTTPGTTNGVNVNSWGAGAQIVATDNGASSAGTLRVTLANNSTGVIASVTNLNLTQGSTTSGQTGPLIQGAVTSAAPSYTNAQTSPLSLTTAGLLRVDASGQVVGVFLGSGSVLAGAYAANSISSGAYAAGSISAGAIAAGASSFVHLEDDASANLDAGVGCLAVRKATPANTSGADGDYEFLQMSAGRVWASAVIDTALPAGTALIGKVGIDQTTPGTTNAVVVTGAAAQGASVSGNPVLNGLEARDTLGTVVATGQVVRQIANRYGANLVSSMPPTHASSNGTPVTATTTSIIAAPSAGNHIRIVRFHISNGGATSCWIGLRDGAAGVRHYNSYLPQNGIVSLNLNSSGPLDLTTATRLDLFLSAAGSVEYEIAYFIVAD